MVCLRAEVRLCLVLLLLPLLAVAQSTSVEVHPATSDISLDGKLDEPAWHDAATLKLTQQSPTPGAATPYSTDVLILMTKDAIYFGFRCVDPQPSGAAVHTMRRDGDLSGDDTVSIILDTFGDRRTGYFFRINSTGARVDGLIANAEGVSLDWDGVWEAKTAKTSDGWTAEIMLPARSLTFDRSAGSWGLNLERFIPRERMALRWSSATLDSFLYDLSRSGALTGIKDLEQGRGLEISPYVTGKTTDFFGPSPSGRSYQAAIGGDVSWRITPQLLSVFTINTDFAETEVDARQINITRFPLFFPEKRAFFLEGANQFEFGLGLGTNFIPFFSRRIGLLGGAQIPINAGVKLNGRIGKWNVAVLDVETRETNVGSFRVPAANLFAGRASYDVTPKLRVGTVITHGDPTGLKSNTLAGVDAVWRTSTFMGNKNLYVGGWTAKSLEDLKPGSSVGWGYKIDFPNDLFDCSHTLHHFGESLDPVLGFLPRPGTQRLTASCSYQPRPAKDGPFRWVRQQFFENDFTRVTNARGYLESWSYFMAPINARFESGDRIEFNWYPQYEFLDAPFEVSSGIFIPAGRYRFTRWRAEAQSSSHRPLQFGHTTWFGTFYNGHLTQFENYLKWTAPRGKLQLELSTENNFGHMPVGNFAQRLWQLQSAYAWNPDLILTSFIQYDSESRNLGSNTRVRWTVKPGKDFFVIWNRGWHQSLIHPDGFGLRPDSDLVAVKVRWTWRY